MPLSSGNSSSARNARAEILRVNAVNKVVVAKYAALEAMAAPSAP
jgi:hypothetical protein